MSYTLARPRTALAVAAVFVAASLLVPSSAAAHSNPSLYNRIAGIHPELPAGVELSIFEGDASELVLVNPFPEPISVLDAEGKPYVRVSSDGVFGDVESPYLAATDGVVAHASPAPPGCCGPGRWMRLSDKNGWAWAEPRLDDPIGRNPAAGGDRGLADLQQGQPLASWEIGLAQADRQFTVSGTLERRPPGRLRSAVDAQPDGLTATVIESRVPQVQLTARPGTVVEVIGSDRRPFIRMTPQGTMGRTASADYQNHMRAIGLAPPTGPDWVPTVGSGPSKATWADFRLMVTGEPPATSGAEPVVVKRWQIPVTVDGKPGEISGTTSWEPILPGPDEAADGPEKSAGVVGYVIAGALTLALVAAAVLARRRVAARNASKESYADQS